MARVMEMSLSNTMFRDICRASNTINIGFVKGPNNQSTRVHEAYYEFGAKIDTLNFGIGLL